uniref:Uncharacterized protein n=1 Tax=Lates calcarifer TaxID=8187 RepID=A0A4W6F9R7_LATCA
MVWIVHLLLSQGHFPAVSSISWLSSEVSAGVLFETKQGETNGSFLSL